MNSDVQATDPSGDALRRAIAAVRDMRERIERLEAAAREPVAIVGMAARLPGAPDLPLWWQRLLDGMDAITEVPPSRWDIEKLYDPDPDAPGRMSSRWGGFIEGVDQFDAGFFGISPREAVGIDPQQRLLLELAWHALEDAGIAPERLKDSATGVFVGISTNDYAQVLSDTGGSGWIDSHASAGNSVAVAAGRIAYQLGLRGPTMAIDTACSSSLVALHQAVRSLRTGESRLALVGGVNLLLRPELTIGFSKARMLAADGRCKTFDAAADGYVRGEGCAVLVLKLLRDAQSDGDPVHAVVLGSAVNHDGRSNGLTAPCGAAQAEVIRSALRDAGLGPDAVGLIEAHGTGTALGDPIEARALAQVYGRTDGTAPWLASVKTQVGHLEAAAGLAGLIKAALAVRDGRLPPQLHFRTLNPHIAQDGFPLRIPRQAQDWDQPGRRVAAVSAFGFSGTNAHVLVAAPPEAGAAGVARPPEVLVLPLSARSPGALAARREALAHALAQPGTDLAAVAATLGVGRAHHAHRMAVCAEDAGEAIAALARAEPAHASAEPVVALLFTGQGSQFAGMARGLLHEPVVRDTLLECDAVLAPLLGRSLLQCLQDGREDFASTALAQPALFAVELSLARLWESWGVWPAALMGHSLGELVAACHAGAIELAPALRFVADRGRLMQSTAGQGGMLAVLAGAEQVEPCLAGTGAVLAAANSPRQCTVAGTIAALARAEERLVHAGLVSQRLEVATAFHSPVLDAVLPELHAAALELPLRPPRLPIASNLTGTLVRSFEAGDWVRQAREPVRFEAGLRALAEHGCTLFIEVGPQPVLCGFGRATLEQARFVPSLRRGSDDARCLAQALAQVYVAGVPIDWAARSGARAHRVRLPVYPFERARHWPQPKAQPEDVRSAVAAAPGDNLLGTRIDTPAVDAMFEVQVSADTMPFLADHVVFGDVVVPGAMHAVVGLQLACATRAGPGTLAVEDLIFEQPLHPGADGARMQVLHTGDRFEVQARVGAASWVRHASGRITAVQADGGPGRLELDALRSELQLDDSGGRALFDMLASRGIVLGPAFRGIHALWRGQGRALAEIVRPEGLPAVTPLHPALLDACFQCLGATFTGAGEEGGFLPLSVDRITAWANAPEHFFCLVQVQPANGGSREVLVGDFTLCDCAGGVFARVQGLQIKRVQPADPLADMLLTTVWEPTVLPDPDWAQPAALAEEVRKTWPAEPTTSDAQALAEGLNALARASAAQALHAPGLRSDPSLPTGRERLLQRLKQLAGRHTGDAAQAIAARLRAAHPSANAEIDLVARCGEALAEVLHGHVDPLQLLLGDGGSIYAAAGLAERGNHMVAAAAAAAQARAGGRQLRVLEVGAGTGATTEKLLDVLPAGTHYTWTDVSPAFLDAARARFGGRIAAQLFDLEQPPARQGLQAGNWDLVVAANVVHATRDLRTSLRHLRALLAPGGCLLLMESTAQQDWWDIVFGLTDGWWRFADVDLRPDHPLLAPAAWCELLAQEGFEQVRALGVDEQDRLSLLVAQASSTPLLLVHGDGADAVASRELALVLQKQLQAHGVATRVASVAQALAAPTAGRACHLAAVDLLTQPQRVQEVLRDAFELVRAQVAAGGGLDVVTQTAAGPQAHVSCPEAAPLWGLALVASLEHPELGCRRIDIGTGQSWPVQALADLLRSAPAETACAWNTDRWLAARVELAGLPAPVAGASIMPQVSLPRTAIVTGGFGGIGPVLASWLLAQGVQEVVLVGRSEPSAALQRKLDTLGPRVHAWVADVTDEAAMVQLLERAARELPPVREVWQLTGRLADGTLLGGSWELFPPVLAAKITAAQVLDRLTRGLDLDRFVLFSSSASLFGNLGQANHAAANAYLDALAAARRARGLPGLSVQWGSWAEVGAVVEGEHLQRLTQAGARPLAPAVALQALERALASPAAVLGVVPLDWGQFLARYGEAVPPFFARVAPRRVPTGTTPARANAVSGRAPVADLRQLMAGVARDDRQATLQAFVQAQAAAVLGISEPSQLDTEQALSEAGLDSLLALELRACIGNALGEKQPATLLFNYPSVAALASYLGQILADTGTPAPSDAADEPANLTLRRTLLPSAVPAADEAAIRADIVALGEDELHALIETEFARATTR